jgi:respiratory nitrate reductase gamma subunit
MESLFQHLDQLLFVLLPYAAAVSFLLLAAARRYGMPPFSRSRPPEPAPSGLQGSRAKLLFGYGILMVLGGHLLGFLIPEQVLIWNKDQARLYILEVTGLVFGLLTLVGLLLIVAQWIVSADARRDTGPADWFVHALLFLSVGSGACVALFYPWGSSWYAIAVVPYLRSIIKLDPDISFISGLPVLAKVHLTSAYLLLAFLPFSRLIGPLVVQDSEPGRKKASSSVTTAVLFVGLGFSILALVPRLWSAHLPGTDQGYEPVQPIAFSHRVHAGEMQISCLYCHHEAEHSRHAGIPAASICMNCHKSVTTPISEVRAEFELAKQEKRPARKIVSPELEKLYQALGLNDQLQADLAKSPTAIRWVRVHNLPAFTHFDHRAHVGAGVECQHCHGPVETMERVRQVADLSMGWCVNCHREANRDGIDGKTVHASNDCATCHH